MISPFLRVYYRRMLLFCAMLIAGGLVWLHSVPSSAEGGQAETIRVLTPSRQAAGGVYIAPRWEKPTGLPESIPAELPAWSIPRHAGQSFQIGGEPLRDAADVSARYALGWDDAGSWIFVDVRDDCIITAKGAEMWQGDGVQIAVDPGWERGERYDENDLEIGLAPNDRDGQSWCWQTNRPLTPEECTFRVTRTKDGYFVAARLAWNFLKGLDRVKRGVLGLNVLVNDNDGSGRKGWICFAPGISESKSMKQAMTIILRDGKTLVLPAFPSAFVEGFVGRVYLYGFNASPGPELQVQAGDQEGAKLNLLNPVRVSLPSEALGVCDVQVNGAALRGGDVRVLCLLDKQPAGAVVVKRLNLREQVAQCETLVTTFRAEIDDLASRGKPVAYLRGLWAVLESQTRFAKQNLDDPDFEKSDLYRNKALRRLREMEFVTKMLREQIADVRGGKRLDRYRAWRYVTSPVELKDGFFEAQRWTTPGRRAPGRCCSTDS